MHSYLQSFTCTFFYVTYTLIYKYIYTSHIIYNHLHVLLPRRLTTPACCGGQPPPSRWWSQSLYDHFTTSKKRGREQRHVVIM